MLEQVKTFKAIKMKLMYFAYEKDMNFGGPDEKCYELNTCIPLKYIY